MSETQVIDWEDRYRTGNTRWERAALHPAFLAWRRSGELAPCRILVPGAGRSPEPEALVEAGFTVTVLDVASRAAEAQRERLGTRADIVQADLFAWEPAALFDAVYDQTCLCALPPGLMPAYEQRLARWVRPGGVVCALFMQSEGPGGPPFDCPIPEMKRLFSVDRWEWPAVLPPLVPHPSLREEQPALLRRR